MLFNNPVSVLIRLFIHQEDPEDRDLLLGVAASCKEMQVRVNALSFDIFLF